MQVPKRKKKPLTLEHFAALIQRDYLAIRRDMATKADTRQIREEMETGFAQVRKELATKANHSDLLELREDVRRLNEVMVSKADLSEIIRRELDVAPYAQKSDLKDLHDRLIRVEKKLGIEPSRRPA